MLYLAMPESSSDRLFSTPECKSAHTNPLSMASVRGGGIPYEKAGNARRLAYGYKSSILVSLRVFMTKCHYSVAVKVSFRVHSKLFPSISGLLTRAPFLYSGW